MIKKVIQQGRSIACCVTQGAPVVDARSVLPVREHDKIARTPLLAFFNIPIHGISFKDFCLKEHGEVGITGEQ
jgi:hypothetical protein